MLRAAALLTCLIPASAFAYVRTRTQEGRPLHRGDVANIQFAVNSELAAGMVNADGQVVITDSSNPESALRASLSTWSSVPASAVRFAGLQTTSAVNSGSDERHIFVLRDTPENRSLVGSALGIAVTFFDQEGRIVDSDVVFNPNPLSNGRFTPFSTNLAQRTFDLQSVATHEVGHALGASHSGVLAATMFQSTPPEENLHGRLSSDDIAFLTDVYPAEGARQQHGAITGTVSFAGGAPVRGAHVVAVNPATGVTVGGLSSTADGTFSLGGVPPGSYVVYAEPLDGPVLPGNVRLRDPDVDASFVTTFLGGVASPAAVQVVAGAEARADLTIPAGQPDLNIDLIGIAPVGILGNGVFGRSAVAIQAGTAVDLLLVGPGLEPDAAEIRLLGPGISIRPGSILADRRLNINGFLALRATVDVAPRASRTLATIVVTRGSNSVAYSGALVLSPGAAAPRFTAAAVVNAASLQGGGALAPDSWVSLFGENLAPALTIATTVPLPTTLGGTTVRIGDRTGAERAAQLQFVAPGQINFLLPAGTAPGPATIILGSVGGTVTAALQIEATAPGLFAANADGRGPAAAIALRVRGDGSRESFFTFTPTAGVRTNVPIDLGPPADQVFLSLFGTGIRDAPQLAATVLAGGVSVPVLGAGAQGEFAGLDQVNIGPLPASLRGRGEIDIVLTVNGRPANTVRVNIR